jgi:hypothetical protein
MSGGASVVYGDNGGLEQPHNAVASITAARRAVVAGFIARVQY